MPCPMPVSRVTHVRTAAREGRVTSMGRFAIRTALTRPLDPVSVVVHRSALSFHWSIRFLASKKINRARGPASTPARRPARLVRPRSSDSSAPVRGITDQKTRWTGKRSMNREMGSEGKKTSCTVVGSPSSRPPEGARSDSASWWRCNAANRSAEARPGRPWAHRRAP